MKAPATPDNEATRLASLQSLGLLDSAPEERFDRLTRLAKRLFDVPVCLVTLVDSDRQWFKSNIGLPVSETPRELSFCGHAILGEEVFVICNALDDERFADNPLVTGEPNIRFYAGCPLRAPDGSKVGTLCLIDAKHREFDEESQQLLQDLARLAEQEIAAVQLATLDHLTLVSNRRGFEAAAKQALAVCDRLHKPACLLYFDLNQFKPINDKFGHAEGDKALVTFATALRQSFRDSDIIGRMGGDEFGVLLVDAAPAMADAALVRLKQTLAEASTAAQRGYDIAYSVGCIEYAAGSGGSIGALLAAADAQMYAHKKAGLLADVVS